MAVKTPSRPRTKLPADRAKHLQRIKRDLGYYCKSTLKIKDKQGRIVPLTFNQAQRIAQEKAQRQRKETGRIRLIVLKARQEGLSTWTSARFFRRCHLFGNQKAGIVADQKDKGSTLFEMYQRYYDLLADEDRVPTKHTAKGNLLSLVNGSEVTVDTAGDMTAGRASTFQMLHLSEMAFWPKAEDVYVSLVQTVPDEGSEIIIESTANGVGNFFHRMWEDACEGRNAYLPVFLPWWIHEDYQYPVTKAEREEILRSEDPVERKMLTEGYEWEGETVLLSPEQVMWRRRTIMDKCAGNARVFQQEYPSTSREAFLVSGNCFFDEDALTEYETEGTRDYIQRGNIERRNGRIFLQPGERGYLRIWAPPNLLVCRDHGPVEGKFDGVRHHCPGTEFEGCGKELEKGLYVIGADTASGKQTAQRDTLFSDPEGEIGGRDFSAADVYEVKSKVVVAHLHGRMVPEVFAGYVNNLSYYYGTESHGQRTPAMVGVESNHSSGETVIRKLQTEYKHPNLYYSRQMNKKFNKHTPAIGWRTTVTTRMPMLDELAEAIRTRSIAVYSKDTIKEMFTFVRDDTGKPQAQESCHDDRVISLAITLQVARAAQSLVDESKPLPQAKRGTSPTGWGNY